MKENLQEVIEIIKQVRNVSGTNDKINILRRNKDNEMLRKVLSYTYDTDLKFGVQKRSIKEYSGESKWSSLFEMLDELASSNINDKLKKNIGRFITNLETDDEKELVTMILLKDLKMGCNIKNINKAMNLIVTHEIMKGSSWDGTLNGEVAVSLKLDGLRCSFIIENGKAIAKTRQNKIIQGMEDLTKAIEEMFGDKNLFVDGELLAINNENLSSEDLFKKTSSIVNSKGIKKDLTFVAFDITSLEDYVKKENKERFIDRRRKLASYLVEENELIKIAPLYFITDDIDKIYKKLDEVVAEGLEGIMLNKVNGFYEFKRTKQLLKVKKFNDADVLVTDILEGEGRLEGTLGKIEVQFKYKDNVYTNNIGSGFSDDERSYYWEHKDELIGKVVTIKYFEITSNDNGGFGFRFPTWKGREYIRFDKKGIDDTNVE